MTHLQRTVMMIMMLLLGLLDSWTQCTVIDVYPTSPDGINGAVNASAPNDIVQIHPGIYTGYQNCDLTIPAFLTLFAIGGPQKTIIDCGSEESRCINIMGTSNINIVGIQCRFGKAPNTYSDRMVRIRKSIVGKSNCKLPRKRHGTQRKLFSIDYFLTDQGEIKSKITVSKRKRNKPNHQSRRQGKIRNQFGYSNSFGGCIAIFDGSSFISIQNVILFGCEALHGSGLGVSASFQVSIADSSFDSNGMSIVTGDSFEGGGLSMYNSQGKIVGSNFSNNFFATQGYGGAQGIGIFIDKCSGIDLLGPMLVFNNTITAAGKGYMFGVGVYIGGSSDISIIGPFHVYENQVINSWFTQPTFIGGAGMYFSSVANVWISGPVFIDSNRVTFTGNYAYISSAGLGFNNVANASLTGPVRMSYNRISVIGNTNSLFSAAFFSEQCVNIKILGPIHTLSNELTCPGTTTSNSLYGTGFYSTSCVNISAAGWSFFNNSIQFFGNNAYGSAVYVESGTNISFKDTVVQNNSLVSRATGANYGTVYFVNGFGISLVDMIISNNSISSNWDPITSFRPTPDYVQPRRNLNSTVQCDPGYIIISNTAGTLNDGSFEQSYRGGLSCGWQLSPSSTFQFTYVYSITLTEFNLWEGFDMLYLYDGPTSNAPILGQYSGSFNNYICANGRCPSPSSPIISSTGSVFVQFTSFRTSVNHPGFTFNWKLIPANRTIGLSGDLLSNFNQYPILATGVGITLRYNDVTLVKNVSISFNTITSFGLSIGGAIYLESCANHRIAIEDCAMYRNIVQGFHAAAGALAVSKNSIAQLTNCILQQNSVFTTKSICLYTAEKGAVCPSALGGNTLVATASSLWSDNSAFLQGRSYCDTLIQCGAVGGSLSILHSKSQLVVTGGTCSSSTATVTTANEQHAATVNGGGCLYAHDASAVFRTTFLLNNTATSISFGGAVHCSGSSNCTLLSCVLDRNSAKQGGAIAITDTAIARVYNSTVSNNLALSVGGALFIKGDTSFAATNTSLISNFATRASTVYAFNDNGIAYNQIATCYNFVPIGTVSLMLGKSDFMGTTWVCSQPGTVFSQDLTDEFFSLTCLSCDPGTYNFEAATTLHVDRKCQQCPFGARCSGSSPQSNGLHALSEYWGTVNANGTAASFYLCPSGYCCPRDTAVECSYDHCEGNRIGILCGGCGVAYGMRFFGDGCSPNDDCPNDIRWFAVVIAVASVIGVLFLLKTTGNASSGMLSVLLYFYQVLPLIKSTSWKHTFPAIITILQSCFSFSPSGSSANSSGACLIPDMTMSQKIGGKILMQSFIFLALAAVFVVHSIFSTSRHRPQISHYAATLVRFSTIAYTTLVLVPLQMIQCVYIENNHVWWWDGNVLCYEAWQKAGFVAIGVLAPLPFLVILLLAIKWVGQESCASNTKEIYLVLSNGFKHERRWWLGVSLYRRLLMVVVYTAILDQNWKSMAASGLCVIFLVINLLLRPFQSPKTHRSETASLFILSLIAITTSPQLSQMQFGTSETIFGETALEWIQFVLAIFPLVAFVVSNVVSFIPRKRKEDWIGHTTECPMCNVDELAFGNTCQLHQYC